MTGRPRGLYLTKKQARFVNEYLKDLNGSEAAIRAGYSQHSAAGIARYLLAKPHVKAEVERIEDRNIRAQGITQSSVLEQLRRIAFFDIGDIYEQRMVAISGQTEESSVSMDDEVLITRPGDKAPRSITGAEWIRSRALLRSDGWVRVERVRVLKHPADWPAGARAALQGYDTVVRNLTAGDGKVDTVLKIKTESKLQALEMLAKHLGLLKDQEPEQRELIVRWLPPEPVPQVETVEGAPTRISDSRALRSGPEDQMGSGSTPAAPTHRTPTHRISDSEEGPSSSVDSGNFSEIPEGSGQPYDPVEEAIRAAMSESGMSRRGVLRAYPELALGGGRGI